MDSVNTAKPYYSALSANLENKEDDNVALAFAARIAKNQPKVAFSFYVAEAANNVFAQYACGMMLMYGAEGVPQDVPLARYYLESAAQNGSQEAKDELAKYEASSASAPAHISPFDEVRIPGVSEKIWHTEPIFKIQFAHSSTFKEFKALLDQELIDFNNKIVFDENKLLVDIYYFPRLARKVIPQEAMKLLSGDKIVAVDGTIGWQDLMPRDPYSRLFAHMTSKYAEEQTENFEEYAKAWQERCPWWPRGPRFICDTKLDASPADVRHLFDNKLTGKDLILGENHQDAHSFLLKNLRYFSSRGYDTLFLEGLHYEAQPMLDIWFQTPEPTLVPPELVALLGRQLALVRQAKAVGIRVVGIDSEQTYVVNAPHLHAYAKTREKAMNEMACKIYDREKKNGAGKSLFYVGASHALKSPEGISGIATVVDAAVVILRYSQMPKEDRQLLRILSGSESFFQDGDEYDKFIDGRAKHLTAVEYPVPSIGKANPACDIWIEASAQANWLF